MDQQILRVMPSFLAMLWGYLWKPSTDIMGVKSKLNPSKKCKGIKSKADLMLSDLESFKVVHLQKYMY